MASACPRCGGTTSTARNPYFGVGLSVHEIITQCRDCKEVSYVVVPRERPDEASNQRMTRLRRAMKRVMRCVGLTS